MEIELITLADLQSLKQEILSEIRELIKQKNPDSNKKWLKSKDVQRILQISPGTLQTLRNRKLIPFTRLGGVIYYKQEDLKKVMDKKGEDEFEFLKRGRF
ncbi:helix-turn-helix domain-containing protein [Algoriphagus marincola]|uniref:helix-turn-helix domain-containing protein n=1 Tax=Algoriphagus marincola TaxID=264027 RepID=UPI000422EAC6|nr:helix-turn-helix domain-containing protein [Algoriphagus marincola]